MIPRYEKNLFKKILMMRNHDKNENIITVKVLETMNSKQSTKTREKVINYLWVT